MKTFVILFNWTELGVQNAKETVNRVAQATEAFKKVGVTIASIHWTIGTYDLVAVVTAPDEETLTAAVLNLAAGGAVRTTTLRAFDASEMSAIVSKLG